jgi:hypothetical protein
MVLSKIINGVGVARTSIPDVDRLPCFENWPTLEQVNIIIMCNMI